MNNRTHIKTRNSAKEKFLKKNFKINMLQIKKNIVKLGIIFIIQENIGVLHKVYVI